MTDTPGTQTISDIIQHCIKNNIDLNEANHFGVTPLMLASIGNNTNLVRQLLNAKDNNGNPLVDIDAHNTHYETAAHLAYQESAFETLKILIEHGCDTAKESFTGLCLENPEIMTQLKERGIIITPQKKTQRQWKDMPDIIEGLTSEQMKTAALAGKNDPSKLLDIQKELLHKIKHFKIFKQKLLTGFKPINQSSLTRKDSSGWTPLLNAVLIDNIEKAQQRRKNKDKLNPALLGGNSGR